MEPKYGSIDWSSFGLGPMYGQSQAPAVQGSGSFAGWSSPMSGFSAPSQPIDNEIVVTGARTPQADPFAGAELNIPTASAGGGLVSGLGDLSKIKAAAGGGGGVGDVTKYGTMDYAKLGLQGLATAGNLYAGLKQLSLANQQFKYQKGVTDTNLANQIMSYNTALQDKITARAKVQGDSNEVRDAYIRDHSAVRKF